MAEIVYNTNSCVHFFSLSLVDWLCEELAAYGLRRKFR